MFNNLQNDFDFNGKISVPSLLGFNNIENVNYLRRLVLSHYPNLENNDTNALSINEAISPSQSSSSVINPLDKIIITPTSSSSSAIVHAKDGVQFIFDEVHCMLDQEYLRNCWGRIAKLISLHHL